MRPLPAVQTPEVLCVGETMALLAPNDGQGLNCATALGIDVAGGESNVACYLSDLGHRTMWFSRLGQDPLGDQILRYLDEVGVITSSVARDPAPTGVMFKDPASPGPGCCTTGAARQRLGCVRPILPPCL